MTDRSDVGFEPPLSYSVYRAAILVIILGAVALTVWGANGAGPLGALGEPANAASTWLFDRLMIG